jgi:fructokinase
VAAALVIGEALIDIVERDGGVVGEHVGGSPLNVAVGLARLGRPVDFWSYLADDDNGRRIAGHLGDSGARLVAGSTAATRTSTSRARLRDDGAADYEFDIEWRLPGRSPVPPPLVTHTGSIAAVLDPGALALAPLVEAYRASATVTLDPNVRPSLIENPDSARQRIARLVERSDVVKVSDADLHWIDPDRTPEQIACSWLAWGPSIVVVTLGDRGAFAVCAAGRTQVTARPVTVVDTVGAGDAFTAGLIDALWGQGLLGAARRGRLAGIELDALGDALRAASDTAALTVARAGADLPSRAARSAATGT